MNELRKALLRDFKKLYVRQFSTDWKQQRLIRELEIEVMGLDNLEEYINKCDRLADKDVGRTGDQTQGNK